MGTLAPEEDMATGDQRCQAAIGSAHAEPAVEIGAEERVNVDELLALLDPSKGKARAHLVFIKAEYTPVVPAVSDEVRSTVDKAGYFALAKALLDVRTDENGCALAVDIVKVLESELDIEHEKAVAVALALADSKDTAKLVRGFAKKRLERFGQIVAGSRDKVVATAAETKEKLDAKMAEAKDKLDAKMAEAKAKVSTQADEAGQRLQSILKDENTVLGSRRVKRIAEIASDPEKSSGTRVLGSRRLAGLIHHFFPPDQPADPGIISYYTFPPQAGEEGGGGAAATSRKGGKGSSKDRDIADDEAPESLLDIVESLPPIRDGSALDALEALNSAASQVLPAKAVSRGGGAAGKEEGEEKGKEEKEEVGEEEKGTEDVAENWKKAEEEKGTAESFPGTEQSRVDPAKELETAAAALVSPEKEGSRGVVDGVEEVRERVVGVVESVPEIRGVSTAEAREGDECLETRSVGEILEEGGGKGDGGERGVAAKEVCQAEAEGGADDIVANDGKKNRKRGKGQRQGGAGGRV